MLQKFSHPLRFTAVHEMPADFGHDLPVPITTDTVVSFDYDTLSEDVANEARAAEDIIRAEAKTVTASGIQIGRTLNRMRPRFAHGGFTPWVVVQLGMHMRAAQKMMAVAAMADKSGDSALLERLPMYLLEDMSAKTFPEEERQSLIADLSSDTPPDRGVVRERIEQAKARRKEPKPVPPTPEPTTATTNWPIEATPELETVEQEDEPDPFATPPAEPVDRAVTVPPAQIGVRSPFPLTREDVGPLLFRIAERLREVDERVHLLALAVLIGEGAVGRGLCRALRGDPVDDIGPPEVGESEIPFAAE